MVTLQSQRQISDVVFGPYHSRRFGVSLRVNPLPPGARLCNFDCIYCECATESWPLVWELQPEFPSPDLMETALKASAHFFNPDDLDSIVIAGDGEPTLSPYLGSIVDVVNTARDRDWPQARTVVLSNGSTSHKPSVRAALSKLDERVIKLDAGTNWILEQLNRPAAPLTITELVRRISMVPDIIIQSMFVHGPVDNTGQNDVEVWTGWLNRLKPSGVHIYSLQRVPAKAWVREVPRQELQSIATFVESTTGIPAQVF